MAVSAKSSKKRSLRKRAELWMTRVILGLLCRLAAMLPERWACGLGNRLGDLIYLVLARYRKVALSNLSYVFGGEMSPGQIRQLAREVFRNFSKCTMEFLRLPHMSVEDLHAKVRMEGLDNLDEALSHGQGVILLTAHYGNWELMASKMVFDGYPVIVIARDADDADVTRTINQIREGRGYRVISRDGSMLPVVRALKGNQVLGILPDQHDYEGIFVNFFGKPAKTPTGPAALAWMTGARVVPGFSVRGSDDRFTVRFYPALDLPRTGNKQQDIEEWTALITKVIEEHVRANPSQWLWIHNRWKSQPSTEAPVANVEHSPIH